MTDLIGLLREAGSCIDALWESCETVSGADVHGMVNRAQDLRKRIDEATKDVVRVVSQYRLEAPYSFTEEQAAPLASVERRRGMDEAISFLERNGKAVAYGSSFANSLREYADKCVKPSEAEPERKCKNCWHWLEEQCWSMGPVKQCGPEFGCILWRNKAKGGAA